MGLSRCAYAALRGVHESAVSKTIATGRITTEADGLLDTGKVDARRKSRKHNSSC